MIDFDVLEAALRETGRGSLVARLHRRSTEGWLKLHADEADDPEVGIALAELLVTALGPREDIRHHGDLRIGHPTIVNGELVVDGQLVVAAHLIVTGSITATTLTTGYDHRVTVLGDVRTRMLFTDGAVYIKGDLNVSVTAWATGSGWFLRARKLSAKVYVNEGDHPDSFQEREVERSFEVHRATREALGMVFRPELFSQDGRLAGWQLLEPIADGVDVLGTANVSPQPPEQLLPALRRLLEQWTGPQRALLAQVRESWVERLTALDPEHRRAAAKLLRSKIRSPKLRDELELVVEAVERGRS